MCVMCARYGCIIVIQCAYYVDVCNVCISYVYVMYMMFVSDDVCVYDSGIYDMQTCDVFVSRQAGI